MMKLQRRWFAVILNPFIVLGIPETSSLEEAKSAYKKLVLKHHPDVSKSQETSDRFREITEAYGMVKQRLVSRESLGIPQEEGFVSKRPKYNGTVGSVLRDDKVREYINFRPIDLHVPDKDRLGILYKPFWTDQDATHPKTGTLSMIALCMGCVMLYSSFFISLAEKDQLVNQVLYEKLISKYKETELDFGDVNPSLQIVKNDPEYQVYVEKKKKEASVAKYKAFTIAPAVIDRFSPEEYERNEHPRDFTKAAIN